MPSDNPLLTGLKLELAYFSGRAWQSREVGGAGVILRFERVIPRRRGLFQPMRPNEITPRFLERTIRELRLGPDIRLGEPLHQFQGVLAGSPTYLGASNALFVDGVD